MHIKEIMINMYHLLLKGQDWNLFLKADKHNLHHISGYGNYGIVMDGLTNY